MNIVIISGLSGSGKSAALRAFEDLGFFCVDNLPILLFEKFIDLLKQTELQHLALVIDAREGTFLKQAHGILEPHVAQSNIHCLFLDSQDDILIQRFQESRRRHPLDQNGQSLREAIAQERIALKPLRQLAHQVWETSHWTVHDLRRKIFQHFDPKQLSPKLRIHIMSFGFKYGIPQEANLVFDLRFLKNPYFVSELRSLRGTDPKVADYVFQDPNAEVFLQKILDQLDFLIPLYEREGKSYLTIALGCTGGHHRSVAMAEALYRRLASLHCLEGIRHRDIGK